MKDTLGQPHLSFVRRLSSLRYSKCIGTISGPGDILWPQAASFIERLSLFYCVHYWSIVFHNNLPFSLLREAVLNIPRYSVTSLNQTHMGPKKKFG